MARFLFTAIAALTLAACSDSTAPAKAQYTGRYLLQQVNGGGLPAVIYQDDLATIQLTGGALTINEDRSFLFAVSMSSRFQGQVTTEADTVRGTYTHDDVSGAMAFTAQGSTVPGSHSGNAVTLSDEGLVMKFVK
ncbi:MAG: hypothetical protein JWO05_877 [Gemmatimonadetes bacterium]|nr:hypothetical protein [Gemmatimonadota bacterium]